MQSLYNTVGVAQPLDLAFLASRGSYVISRSCGQLRILLNEAPDSGQHTAEAVHIPRAIPVVVDYPLFIYICSCAENSELARADIHDDAPFKKHNSFYF